MSHNPAVEEAKQTRDPFAARTSLDGVAYQLHPVAPALLDAVIGRLQMPTPPMWHNPDMDRDEPNPSHPEYLRALEEFNRQRGIASYDAMVMFGILLPEGLPQDDTWARKLQYLAKHGQLDLSGYDLEDEMDREFLYKRYILSTADMVAEIGQLSSVTGEEVSRAGRSFPGDA